MGKGQKIITVALWTLLLSAMVGVVGGKLWMSSRAAPGAAPAALPVLYPAADFALTDQDARPLGSADLRGRPWIGAFVFTTCGSVCPQMTSTMVELQKQLPAAVHLVSFTVDPNFDTPAVLKEYAARYKADTARWHFLTGTQKAMYDVAAGMRIAAKPAEGENPILHSEKLILVDGAGNVRGYYNSIDPDAVKRLVADAATVAKERP